MLSLPFPPLIYLGRYAFRLCQDMVLFKAEAAELLLPRIFVNIAARKNLEVDLHKLMSLQVIF